MLEGSKNIEIEQKENKGWISSHTGLNTVNTWEKYVSPELKKEVA
jgi:hypothetical protein